MENRLGRWVGAGGGIHVFITYQDSSRVPRFHVRKAESKSAFVIAEAMRCGKSLQPVVSCLAGVGITSSSTCSSSRSSSRSRSPRPPASSGSADVACTCPRPRRSVHAARFMQKWTACTLLLFLLALDILFIPASPSHASFIMFFLLLLLLVFLGMLTWFRVLRFLVVRVGLLYDVRVGFDFHLHP